MFFKIYFLFLSSISQLLLSYSVHKVICVSSYTLSEQPSSNLEYNVFLIKNVHLTKEKKKKNEVY